MGNQLAYSGVSTKIRSMHSSLLTDRDYEQMAQLSSVNEAAEYLRQKTAFKEMFSSVTENTLHRATLERLLYSTEYHDFIKIYRFSGVKVREYLNLYFMNYERDYLKTVLRGVIENGQDNGPPPGMGDFFDRHASFSVEKMAQAKTIGGFIHALAGSPYHAYLHPLHGMDGVSLFDYEMAIDAYVFTRLWKQQKKQFSGRDYDTLCKTYGCRIDLMNLMWIYRSKKYYKLKPAEIYRILLPVNYKLSSNTIRRMTEAGTIEEFGTLFQNTYYGLKYKIPFTEDRYGFNIEKIYHALLYHIHNREFRNHPFSVAVVNSYLYMKHLEVERLITTIEGIRYGLPVQMIIEQEKKFSLEVLDK